jgi:hypothetical protein
MYEWGKAPPELSEQLTEAYSMVVGDTLYIERGDRVIVNSYKYSPTDGKLLEEETGLELWNKIKSEGHTPLYVRIDVTVFSVEPPSMIADVYSRYAFRIEHNPIEIIIAVGWAVAVIVGFIVAYLTSPYWGPLLWRAAGYEAGEVPPSPPTPSGLNEIVILFVILFAIIFFWKGGFK